jgi:hypothetical protein
MPLPPELKAPADWGTRCHNRPDALGASGIGKGGVPGKSANFSDGRGKGSGCSSTAPWADGPRGTTGGKGWSATSPLTHGNMRCTTDERKAPESLHPRAPPPLAAHVASSLDVRPWSNVRGYCDVGGVPHAVPFLPSDLGDTVLGDSHEVLVVELTGTDGSNGWLYSSPQGARLLSRGASGALRSASVRELAVLVGKKVDVLTYKSKNLSKSLYRPCAPLKHSSLMVTLVPSDDLEWTDMAVSPSRSGSLGDLDAAGAAPPAAAVDPQR